MNPNRSNSTIHLHKDLEIMDTFNCNQIILNDAPTSFEIFLLSNRMQKTSSKKEQLEFFKLDEIDRRVFFWLIEHVKLNSVKSWIEYIKNDYERRSSVLINQKRLLAEAKKVFPIEN